MAKIKATELSEEQRIALVTAWHHGPSHAFRQRCQMILLKAQWLTSRQVADRSPTGRRQVADRSPTGRRQVADQVGCCEVVVNTWLNRYQAHGLDGLKTRRGQARRPILQADTDLAAVRRAVQNNRQRVSLAKAELTKELGKEFPTLTLRRFLKKGDRFKRIRRQVKRKPNADIYAFKREFLVVMPSERSGGVNCFALLSRDNRLHRRLTEGKVTAAWISEQLNALSLSLARLTVVVLDNASVHVKAVKERAAVWQELGLFVFFLPPYCPHLNIAEILWRKLKYEWLLPEDYADKETLHHTV